MRGDSIMKNVKFFLLLLVFVLGLVACGQQKALVEPEDVCYDYCYEEDGFGGDFTISVHSDGTFSYYEGMLSSYIGVGTWELEGDILVLSDDAEIGYPFVNRFRVDGEDLVFLAEDSSNFIYVKVSDGERFVKAEGVA